VYNIIWVSIGQIMSENMGEAVACCSAKPCLDAVRLLMPANHEQRHDRGSGFDVLLHSTRHSRPGNDTVRKSLFMIGERANASGDNKSRSNVLWASKSAKAQLFLSAQNRSSAMRQSYDAYSHRTYYNPAAKAIIQHGRT
jgi:hypothetical protein